MTIARIRNFLAAAVDAPDARMQAIYLASARATLAALRTELGAAEVHLLALEAELVRRSGDAG